MKTKLVLGMLAFTFVASNVMAAAPAINVRAKLTEYIDATARPHILGAGVKNSSGLAKQAATIANDKILNNLELRGEEISRIKGLLTVKAGDAKSAQVVEKRLDNLIVLAGARQAAKAWTKDSNPAVVAEATSLLKATDALVRTLSNSEMTRAREKSDLLNKEELSDTSLALENLEKIIDSVLTMKKDERDMYVAVELKRDELLQGNRLTGEEALLQAIMQVRNVSKDKAMEIIRKLKDCA